jgi:ATP-dependent exoDNAse (exonuclease V) alpha subunit
MAIYHFSASFLKRSEGRSVVAAAAYRAGVALNDERTGKAFDYRRKGGVLHAEIIAPENAPSWMRDRGQLWNHIEAFEKRKDAQLAREVRLALPHELDHPARAALVHAFVTAEFVRLGMMADIALHAPGRHGDDRNHHAHILLTLRAVAGDSFGNKRRDWSEPAQLEHWRSAWAAHVNRALEAAEVAARIDHRSLAEQGVDRIPQIKLGVAVQAMQRKGIVTDRAILAETIAAANTMRRLLGEELLAVVKEIEALRLAAVFQRAAQMVAARDLWRMASAMMCSMLPSRRGRAGQDMPGNEDRRFG